MRRATLAALIAPVLAASAAAQDFPNKTIRIVVGFPAGGPSDVPARILAEKLRVLGQPVIVENKTGAAGMIALADMLAQPRDGHTLLLCSISMRSIRCCTKRSPTSSTTSRRCR